MKNELTEEEQEERKHYLNMLLDQKKLKILDHEKNIYYEIPSDQIYAKLSKFSADLGTFDTKPVNNSKFSADSGTFDTKIVNNLKFSADLGTFPCGFRDFSDINAMIINVNFPILTIPTSNTRYFIDFFTIL